MIETDERRRKVEEMDMQQDFLSQQQRSLKSLLSYEEDCTTDASMLLVHNVKRVILRMLLGLR